MFSTEQDTSASMDGVVQSARLQTWKRFLESGYVRPVYQPIVELASGRVIGYEVLSRAYDLDGTLIYLEDLFAAATEAGQLHMLDERLCAACFEGATSQAVKDLRFFINVLPQTLRSPVLYQALSTRTHRDVPVVLEVNERTADPAAVLWDDLLDPLRRLGVEVAIDDVGSGYAGLNRTVEMTPNWIKMDIALVRGIDSNPLKSAMVASIVTFAKRLGNLHVVAEGVETRAEYETLVEMGVDFAQGYALARPEPHLLATACVTLPNVAPRVHRVDFARYGVVLADFVQRVGEGRMIVKDIQLYVNQIMDIDRVDVISLNAQGYPIDLPGLSPVPAPLLARLQSGHEVITQHIEGLERPISQVYQCQCSVLIPILTQEGLHGVLYGGFEQPHAVRSEVVTVLRGFAAVLTFQWGNLIARDRLASVRYQ